MVHIFLSVAATPAYNYSLAWLSPEVENTGAEIAAQKKQEAKEQAFHHHTFPGV